MLIPVSLAANNAKLLTLLEAVLSFLGFSSLFFELGFWRGSEPDRSDVNKPIEFCTP